METNFNFESSVCTSREQSQRLLALSLKKETADCVLIPSCDWDGTDVIRVGAMHLERHRSIPAWSLHRLIKMMPKTIGRYFQYTCNDSCGYMDEDALNMNGGFDEGNIYDSIISCIEWLIEKGYFNKKYLENGNC